MQSCITFILSTIVLRMVPVAAVSIGVADIRGLSGTQGLTLSVAAGLLNRHPDGPLIYPQILPNDDLWLVSLKQDYADSSFTNVTHDQLLQQAVKTGAANSTILFSAAEPWTFATVLTLCALHSALPMPLPSDSLTHAPHDSSSDESSAYISEAAASLLRDLPVAVNISGLWSDEVAAASWAVENVLPACAQSTELVVVQRPDLVAQGFLADYVAQHSLFTFWLPDMCNRSGGPSNALYQSMTEAAHAEGHFLTLMGYFPSQEVVATCSKHHTEVSLVSDFSSSLSFWSLLPLPSMSQSLHGSMSKSGQEMTQHGMSHHRMSQPQLPPQPPVRDVQYNSEQTYVAVIVSDGDNMQMAFNWDRAHMDQRVAICTADPSYQSCPPLSWTISNHLAEHAPYVLQWYYRQAKKTGQDSFLLGPSGAGFLHPSLIDASDPLVQVFVNETLDALKLLGASAWVQWDEYDNHLVHNSRALQQQQSQGSQRARQPVSEEAMQAYVARFKGTGISVFSPIMPYLPPWIDDVIPTFAEWVRWWDSKPTAEVADFLNQSELKGQLGYVYMIIDVGMDRLKELTSALQPHVELVGYRELVELAHQKRDAERKNTHCR